MNAIDEYHRIAHFLNKQLFNDEACPSCISPSQLMRRPNVINKKTGKIQEITHNVNHIIEVYLPVEITSGQSDSPLISDSVQAVSNNNRVQAFFETIRHDHDGENGGRGKKNIFAGIKNTG